MKELVLIDANVIIRFLLNDHPKLSSQAKALFLKAQQGKIRLYFDEVVIAETVWVLKSFYKIERLAIVQQLETLLAQDWIVNPRKNLLLKSLIFYKETSLDYIDCWVIALSQVLSVTLETYNEKVKKRSYA